LEQVAPSFFFTEARWQDLVKQLTESKLRQFLRSLGRARRGNPTNSVPSGSSCAIAKATSPPQLRLVACKASSGAASAIHPLSESEHTQQTFLCSIIHRYRRVLHPIHRVSRHLSLQAAADEVIQKRLVAAKGDGGVIALTPNGQIAWSYNTPGMFRGKLTQGGAPVVSVFKNEP